MLTWTSWDEFWTCYFDNKSHLEIKKFAHKRVVKDFHQRYPSPNDWLMTPLEYKQTIKYQGYSDLYYIISWAWDNKLFKDTTFSNILLEYMIDSRHSSSRIPIWFAQKLNLITAEEITIAREISGYASIVKSISIHCILLMKRFKDFSDNDAFKYPGLFKHAVYTAKSLQNIRIKLGYSQTIVRVIQKRRSKWEKLFSCPIYGSMYTRYFDYLVRSDARKKYLSATVCALVKLDSFLKLNNLKDCSTFTVESFTFFTEYLRQTSDVTATSTISKIKKFFEWGCGVEPFFPASANYPTRYWQSLFKKVKKERKNTDGRAFDEPSLAEKIVDIVETYTPHDEVEELCRLFWLVIASCPARFSYILNLGDDALQPLPNEPSAYGVYSPLSDKAGNKHGQFPLLDQVGISAVKQLQERAKSLNLKPVKNPDNLKTYVHLFQLTSPPWLLSHSMIRSFFKDVVNGELSKIQPDFEDLITSGHAFRHHLLTHIACMTGDITVVQTAAGHLNETMTREYLKSKVSKRALLFRVVDKYESKQITGKFYLRLVELLSYEDMPVDEMLRALTTEMQLDEFIKRYGKKLDMGYCFEDKGCANWYKCWNCTNFLMTREEIQDAIKVLAHQLINIREMQKFSATFNYDSPIVYNQLKVIGLIVKRLTELDLSEEQINLMLDNYLHGRVLEEGVIS